MKRKFKFYELSQKFSWTFVFAKSHDAKKYKISKKISIILFTNLFAKLPRNQNRSLDLMNFLTISHFRDKWKINLFVSTLPEPLYISLLHDNKAIISAVWIYFIFKPFIRATVYCSGTVTVRADKRMTFNTVMS